MSQNAVPSRARNNCWQQLRADPLRVDKRQHLLKGRFSHHHVGDKRLQQWQYEVTGVGPVWYCPDSHERIVWLADAFVGHPKATE
jgi:hypothetical protein